MRRAAWSDRALCLTFAFAISCGHFASLRAQAPPPESIVQVRLTPSHQQYRRRIENAANESIARLSEWLGPLPEQSIVIVDRSDATDPASIAVDLRWRPAPSTMDVESQVSYALAKRWWPRLADNGDDRPVVNGVAWYLQSRLVERLYDFAFLNPGHSSDAVRFFGGALPWEFPLLRMTRWTSGLSRFEYLRGNPRRIWPAPARRLPDDLDEGAIWIALAFGSVERSAGWPAVQGALFEWARQGRAMTLSRARLIELIGDAIGQDASGLFAAARAHWPVIDYAVGPLASTACSDGGCLITKVTTQRAGNVSGFGDVELRVEFADGQQVEARWNGDATSKQFEFESPAAPAGVHIDPNRTVLLDENWLNNDRLVTPRTNVPIRKWVARWVVWLQDASLSYASLF